MAIRITWIKEVYEKTESGKSWKTKPSETETEVIPEQYYWNMASKDSLRFWNGFCGGTCRAVYGYTCFGYTPIRITRQNPDRDKKYVDRFHFDYLDD